LHRVGNGALGGAFGTDSERRLVVSLIPGDGRDIPDCIEIRPHNTRRPERAVVKDVYKWLVACRANREHLERARAAKARRAQVLADARQARAERRLFGERGTR
jgi:hypothetical protein